jgi:hypothetical protein
VPDTKCSGEYGNQILDGEKIFNSNARVNSARLNRKNSPADELLSMIAQRIRTTSCDLDVMFFLMMSNIKIPKEIA